MGSRQQRLGPPSTVCGSYFDTTYIRIVAAHVHPFWKCFHKAIEVLALFEEHRHNSEVLTWAPCFPDLIGGSGGVLAQTRR